MKFIGGEPVYFQVKINDFLGVEGGKNFAPKKWFKIMF